MTRRLGLAADPWVTLAVTTTLALVAVAALGSRLAPHEPIVFVVEHGSDPRPYEPGLVYLLGSDVLGRDLFSLLLYGANATLSIVLLAGSIRVLSGVALAAAGSWWRPARAATEWLAEFVSAVPATLIALVVVKVFARPDSGLLIFIGALLLMGWAGPYRVVRSELDRLAHAPFTHGARAIGVGRWRLFWRHELPHLVPVIAFNLSQQVVASLVLVAELGVLGTFVGETRTINIEESLSRVLTGPVNVAEIADPPEWGGLLANARTIESLWTTRWLVFVPGVAFALTAAAVALIGFALARRYSRADLVADLRGRGSIVCASLMIGVIALGSVLPEQYAAARDWAASARVSAARHDGLPDAFAEGGLEPLAPAYSLRREISTIERDGPASISVGGLTLSEQPTSVAPDAPDASRDVRAFVTATTGGGVVDAPLVYVGRGVSPDDFPPSPPSISPFQRQEPGFAQLLRDFQYADDYAHVDVRGKVVLLVRFLGIRPRTDRPSPSVNGPEPDALIANAVRRGAAGVVFIDPALNLYTDVSASGSVYVRGDVVGGTNPYGLIEAEDPPEATDGGVPVVILSERAGRDLGAQVGIDVSPYFHLDERGGERFKISEARPLAMSARMSVPLRTSQAVATSYGAATDGARSGGDAVLVWNVRRAGSDGTAALAALARVIGRTSAAFVIVDFDPAIDAAGNARAIRTQLERWRITEVVVLDHLRGSTLRFITPYGDLIPAFDLYAQRSGARVERTTTTARISELAGLAPFIDLKTIVITGVGADGELAGDAAALLAYIAGRQVLGAEELGR